MNRLWTPWRMSYLQGEEEKNEDCVFCNKPSCVDAEEHILYRAKFCYITLNRYPYTSGHVMVVPFAHVSSLEVLEPLALTEMMLSVNVCLVALRRAYQPHGFNVGINLGVAAGAGIADHLHTHVVPRWSADSNFMPVVGQTRIIPETLDGCYARLRPIFDELSQGAQQFG